MNARDFFDALPIPIIQAPMVGAQGVELALAVSGAGGLGSLGCGGMGPDAIEREAGTLRASGRPFALNLFVLQPARPPGDVIAAAIARLAPWYAELGLPPPEAPNDFAPDFEAQFAAVVRSAPQVASFTFDRLPAAKVAALQARGSLVVGTATTVAEARAWAEVGADAICAQGFEAGGHRGHFLAEPEASLVGTMALVPAMIAATGLPTVAAGGIMDGRGVAAALALGASAVQMGTAFLLVDEAQTNPTWRAALSSAGDDPTRLTRAITGRHARGLETRYMRQMRAVENDVPAYPVQNRLTQPLRAAAVAAGVPDVLQLWAGQGVKQIRSGRAADLVAAWWAEAKAAAQQLAEFDRPALMGLARAAAAFESPRRSGGAAGLGLMHRRSFLAGVALASVAGRAIAQADDLRSAAREAWLYCLPLIELARRRAADGAAGINGFVVRPSPQEPDVLTASAWIKLADNGSATLRVPSCVGRYASVTALDMFGNVLGVFGAGAKGEDGGAFTLLGPQAHVGVAGYTMPEPRLLPLRRVTKVRSPWVWALARAQTSGEGGEDFARSYLAALRVEAKSPSRRAPVGSVSPDANWSDYFYAGQRLIEENPPPGYEADFFRRIAALQLGMAGGFERARFADSDLDQVAAGASEGRLLAAGLHPSEGVEAGWLWPRPELGDYGQAFLYRAQVALNDLGAPPIQQMLTLRAAAADDRLEFDADAHYRLTLPEPPPAAFWTLSLYQVAADGRLLPAANAIDRHYVGSSTDLRGRPDGGIDVWIGQADPGGSHTPNWLPAPAAGTFALVLRAYLPGEDLLTRRYRPPPLEVLAPSSQPPPPRRRRLNGM